MPTSFRDPGGHVALLFGRVFRFVNEAARADFVEFTKSGVAQKLIESGRLISSRILEPDCADQARSLSDLEGIEPFSLVAEHERVPFPSFPYEWPAEMLFAAGELTLDLCDSILPLGFGLKDATPYNVLFRGASPVFIDMLSFERREPRDPTWLPSAQFGRTFLRPLLLSKKFAIPPDQSLLAYRDGLDAEQIAQMLPFPRQFSPAFLGLVSIPAFFSKRRWAQSSAIYQKRTVSSKEQAEFIIERLFKSLRKKLNSLMPRSQSSSAWTSYADCTDHPNGYFSAKAELMQKVINSLRPARVLDVGCNTGFYSIAAARQGAQVVSIDSDRAVLGRLYSDAARERLNILPLVVDLTRPTPGMGWRNSECAPFVERATGYFDSVFMLAVIHHMLVRERIPLSKIFDLAAELTTDYLVIEYVDPSDPLFTRIARGNDHLYTYLTPQFFELVAQTHFDIEENFRVGDSQRRIYVLKKRERGDGEKQPHPIPSISGCLV